MSYLERFKAAGAQSVGGDLIHASKTVAHLRNGVCIPTADGEALLARIAEQPAASAPTAPPTTPAPTAPPATPEPTAAPKPAKPKSKPKAVVAETAPVDDLDDLLNQTPLE